jgi:hypothetical protein
VIDFPDAPVEGELFSSGPLTWKYVLGKWQAASSAIDLSQGEVWGNPDPTAGPAVPAALATMIRADLGDGVAGQALLSGGTGIDPAWGTVAGGSASLPSAAQGEVLGNPATGSAVVVPTQLARMIRASLGDGVAGQVITSAGPGVDPGWGNVAVALKYVVGAFVPGVLTANQLLLVHRVGKAITIPANFGAYAGYISQASGTVAATASTVITVARALSATPTSFTTVGTITFGAGGLIPTFATTGGTAVSYAQGDLLRLTAPASPDATFAGFACTLVAQET